MTSTELLVHYDNTKEIVLVYDASPYCVDAVISYIMKDGEEKPTAHTSLTLAAAEKKYTQTDKEGLPVLKKFHQMYGRCVTKVNPLTQTGRKVKPLGTMTRMNCNGVVNKDSWITIYLYFIILDTLIT